MSLYKKIEAMYRHTLFSRHDDDGSLFYFSASDFPGLCKKVYNFNTERGNLLHGYFYFYPGYNEQRLIVFDHGLGNGHRAYMKEIEMLARHGYLVYSYDHTGCTESEGEHIMGFSGSLYDLDACISKLKSDDEYNKKKISVIGHSWGGFSTMNILAYHLDIESIVAMSGFISVREIQRQMIPFPLSFAREKLFLLEKETNPNHAESSALDTLSSTIARALIIHSIDDKTVKAKLHFNVLRRVLAGKENIEFLALVGKDHNPNYTTNAVKYKNAFFKILQKKRKKGELSSAEQKSVFKKLFDWDKMTEQDEDVWSVIFEFLDK